MHPRLRTMGLMLLLSLLFGAIGWFLGGYFFLDPLGSVVFFLLLAGLMNFVAYFWSHKIVLWSYRARVVSETDAPQLHRVVRQAAQMLNAPMPRVAIVPTATPNAFATGRNPQHAVVAATEGILRILDERELTGVMAHEMSHVVNRDILIMSVAATLAGAIAFMARIFFWGTFLGSGRRDAGHLLIAILVAVTAPIAALLVQLAISRSREFDADRTGAWALGDPEALASALEKLEYYNARRPIDFGNPASQSLFIVNPFRGSAFFRLFRTHPTTEERVRRLRQLARAMGR